VTNDILKKLSLVGKNPDDYSIETVKMLADDAISAGFKLKFSRIEQNRSAGRVERSRGAAVSGTVERVGDGFQPYCIGLRQPPF
jgi:hypothetical protein